MPKACCGPAKLLMNALNDVVFLAPIINTIEVHLLVIGAAIQLPVHLEKYATCRCRILPTAGYSLRQRRRAVLLVLNCRR